LLALLGAHHIIHVSGIRVNYTAIPQHSHIALTKPEAFLTTWEQLLYSLLMPVCALCYQPLCHYCFHLGVVFKFENIIPQTEAVKYLGLHFDCRLNWKEHSAINRKQMDLKVKEMNWLIGKNPIYL
jgi:hypothetical protein